MSSFESIVEPLLNRNVSSIIIAYLTDPPPLPFLEELQENTIIILNDTTHFWFNKYEKIHSTSLRKSRTERVFVIRYRHCRWRIYER